MNRLFVLPFLLTTLLVAGTTVSADIKKGAKAYGKKDYAAALKEFKPLAEQGDAIAQYNLGGMYQLGRGVPKDNKEAVKWFRLAAEQGHVNA